ncbi:MAG: ATP-binding protein, partial [Acidimicrobiia bacterium]
VTGVMGTDGFCLGGIVDAGTGERTGELVEYDPGDLTTHGVIVGMTGSGKTGLGIIYLEEALLAGIPTLVIDPKGDMTNLLLTFPDLLPSDFEPWVDASEARREDKTVSELAADKAALWAKGLGWWDMDPGRIGRLRDGADFTIYTPGSSAGESVNIVGSLAPPPLDWEVDAETLRDEIQGFVSGLLGLIGVDADPISSREHILLSNLVEHAWRNGTELNLETLLAQVHRPPLRKLGVFEVDTFFPEKDRLALAMRLNGLVASPAFAAWMDGPPLDIERMLWDEDDMPRAAVVYLAHLSEEERQFVVTLLLSKVVTWMRSQAGASNLRALVYMDEVFGFVPPTAEPPSKRPILTMLKQARAFGVGLLLSTQNPVDLDYKAMSNAGTWCIGRLQTERDKGRILEALQSASGDNDVSVLDAVISGLDKRQFLLHSTRGSGVPVFTTRWALSYLAGPLTREQVTTLSPHTSRPEPSPTPAAAGQSGQAETTSPQQALHDDETQIMPDVADTVRVFHLDAGAPWASRAGATPGARRHEAALAARVHLLYDDTRAGVGHREEWEAVFTPLAQPFDPDSGLAVDYDDRDLLVEGPSDATYVIPDAKVDTAAYFRTARTAIKNHLHREAHITVFKNAALKLYSRVGESESDFLERCDDAAQDRADAAAAKLRDKYSAKVARARKQLDAAERRIAELEVDIRGRQESQFLDQAGAVLGVLFGRRSTRSITGSARSRSATRSAQQRLRTSEAKADDAARLIADLESELTEELTEINDTWEARGMEIETVEIGLEKDDIDVSDLAVVWLPVSGS